MTRQELLTRLAEAILRETARPLSLAPGRAERLAEPTGPGRDLAWELARLRLDLYETQGVGLAEVGALLAEPSARAEDEAQSGPARNLRGEAAGASSGPAPLAGEGEPSAWAEGDDRARPRPAPVPGKGPLAPGGGSWA